MKKGTLYKNLKVGSKFTYDGETFIKHEDKTNDKGKPFGIAWSLHNGKPLKEWAFGLEDKVHPVQE